MADGATGVREVFDGLEASIKAEIDEEKVFEIVMIEDCE